MLSHKSFLSFTLSQNANRHGVTLSVPASYWGGPAFNSRPWVS